MIQFFNSIGGTSSKVISITTQEEADALTPQAVPNGYTIRFAAGNTYNIGYSFKDQSNISIDRKGAGSDPILIGSTPQSWVWTNEGGDVWSAPLVSAPDWVYINKEVATLAETPWILVTDFTASTLTINNADVSGYGDIVNSGFYYKSYPWKIHYTNIVDSYDSGTGVITALDPIEVTPRGVHGVKLTNKTAYFSGLNEWAYEGGKLYVTSTAEPTDVRVSNKDTCIKLDNCSSFSIKNMEIINYFQNGINLDECSNVLISSNNIHANRSEGITMRGITSGNEIIGNEIHDCGLYGIVHKTLQGTKINNNNIYDIGMQGNYGFPYDVNVYPVGGNAISIPSVDSEQGYTVTANDLDISYNNIYNIAYNGVSFAGNDNKIHHNIIHDVLLRFTDGGALYGANNLTYNLGTERNEIYNNILYDIIGNLEGLAPGAEIEHDACIYPDFGVFALNVHHNVLYNSILYGIRTDPDCSDMITDSNIIAYCENSSARYQQGGSLYPNNVNNVYTNNIAASIRTNQFCSKVQSAFNPFSGSGSSNNNYYFNPYTNIIGSYNNANQTFAQWQALFGDAASVSKSDWLTYVNEPTAREDVKLYTNETNSAINIVAPSGYEDVDGNDISGQTIEVPAYFGLLILKS